MNDNNCQAVSTLVKISQYLDILIVDINGINLHAIPGYVKSTVSRTSVPVDLVTRSMLQS
jgi:hypothetical protein